MMRKIAYFLSTLGPIGHLPKMPGTWGSAAAILAAPWLFMNLETPARSAILVLILVVGVWASSEAEKHLGRKDPGCVIIDELLGQWIAIVAFSSLEFWQLALAFVLFRLFDILKPWPVKTAENFFPGGVGVMLDDVVAGIYAAITMWAIFVFTG